MRLFSSGYLPTTYEWIIKLIFPPGKQQVLDLGCGTGVAAVVFKSTDREFIGVDVFLKYLTICRKLGVYKRLIKADLETVKFPAKSFDVVLLFQVIEHLPKAKAVKLLNKASRIARQAVIVTVPNGACEQHEYDGNPHQAHQSEWSAPDLTDQGFRVYGQGLKAIYGHQSYGSGKGVLWWQKIMTGLSLFLWPVILFYPPVSSQLICIKKINHD